MGLATIGLLGEVPEAYVGVLREINNQSATLILGMFALLAGRSRCKATTKNNATR
jgi:hypothetical protein